MIKIEKIFSREILDSRGYPTIEVDVILNDGSLGRSSVPSGASTGKYEAIEKRDENFSRYFGKGVLTAIQNVNGPIFESLIGEDPTNQIKIDEILIKLDSTKNKNNLGANSLLGVSLAVAKASAKSLNLPLFKYLNNTKNFKLPVPMMNILNGGMHANNSLDIQEFMIMPISAKSFKDACRIGAEIYHELRNILQKKGLSTSVGDEGGFAPHISKNKDALDLIINSIEKANYKPQEDVVIAIDCASTEYFKNDKYFFEKKNISLTKEENAEFLNDLANKYPIFSIEDGMSEDDWDGWKLLYKKLSKKCQLVGDDLFVTNTERLRKGIDKNIANAILIKCNQIGTLSETISAVNLANKHSMNTVMSHRSGETEDNIISDLSVALNCNQVKFGAPCRSERLSKYNQLIRIEESLGNKSIFFGKEILKN